MSLGIVGYTLFISLSTIISEWRTISSGKSLKCKGIPLVVVWIIMSTTNCVNVSLSVAVVYCDYTASGRSLQFIEDYILKEVLPLYGNTHTTTTITSMQSTLFR